MPELQKIGIAGCGAMGFPMAKNLHKNGFYTFGYDIKPKEEFEGFAEHMCDTAKDLAKNCPVIFSVVRDWQQTQELCFGTDGLFINSYGPEIFVVSSTLSPRMVLELQEQLPTTTTLVDAPMSGTTFRAEEGSLTFMVGGDKNAVSKLMDALHAMGNDINYLGPLGAGMTCKVLNNLLAATTVVAVRNVMKAAEELHFSPEILLNVARTSSGSTWFGDNIEKISWSDEGYSPDNTIGILEKDVMSLLDATQDKTDLRVNGFGRQIIAELQNLQPLKK
jgi:3-hydroxyisobutyrate dehydrogenase-like beta-hydroxyacid dehydrogenase